MMKLALVLCVFTATSMLHFAVYNLACGQVLYASCLGLVSVLYVVIAAFAYQRI